MNNTWHYLKEGERYRYKWKRKVSGHAIKFPWMIQHDHTIKSHREAEEKICPFSIVNHYFKTERVLTDPSFIAMHQSHWVIQYRGLFVFCYVYVYSSTFLAAIFISVPQLMILWCWITCFSVFCNTIQISLRTNPATT